jgi:alpha-beta hydrolase superfamily lysophospholipase
VLSAEFWPGSGTNLPAVVLVHMLTRSSRDWDVTAERLHQAGFVVLALDLRGHGDSSGSLTAGADLSPMLQDVVAALGWLKHRPEVATARIGIAGASVGASLAIQAAAADPSIRSVALLSPGIEYRGLRSDAAMRKYGDRPVLLIASKNDPYALRSSKALAEEAPRTQLETLDDAGHGTVMLTKSDGLVGRLVDWFKATLL